MFSLLLTILGRTSPAEDWVGLLHNEALVRDAVVGVGAHDIGAFRQAGKVYLGGECPDLLLHDTLSREAVYLYAVDAERGHHGHVVGGRIGHEVGEPLGNGLDAFRRAG